VRAFEGGISVRGRHSKGSRDGRVSRVVRGVRFRCSARIDEGGRKKKNCLKERNLPKMGDDEE
jgi:hypothetical protein